MSVTLDPPPSTAVGSTIHGTAVRRGDRVFSGISRGAGVLILVIMGAIAVFLIWRAIPAFQANTANFFTTEEWLPDLPEPVFGIAALTFGTVVTAAIAMLLAVPVGYGIALFIAYYASKRLAASLAFITDLLAAVPSIIFGLWGLSFLQEHMVGLGIWLDTYLGWIPLFANDLGLYTKSILVAAVVLAIMILPTVSALSREVFVQVPKTHVEAALALGATRWEMVRMSVIPFAKPGMISAAMLGLGRALGETIAVALVLSAVFDINWHITEPGGNTFAANIALKWNEAGPIGLSALVASGLVLFVITLAVNVTARAIIARRAEFSGANG
jgi:phosphate transport system permease protein